MMKKADYACLHTHTSFCDGKGDVESFCQSAWKKGLCSLGFSSHAPIFRKTGFRTSWNMKEEILDQYLEEVNAAKRRWEGRLRIFLGLEVDFIPGLMGPADKDLEELGLDYIIGSVHYVLPPRGAPFCVDSPPEEITQAIKEGYGGDSQALIADYYSSLEQLIRGKGFDILGHPDLIKRNNRQMRFFDEGSEFYGKKCAAIAKLAGAQGITIEVNTGGLNRGTTDAPYPSLPLLKMFRENKVPALINADAHNPEDLDGHYNEAREALLEAGYQEMFLFEGRKNNCPQWRRAGLRRTH